MNIIQLDLNNKKQVNDFLRLPFSIYRDIPQWVPPLQMDERLRLSPKRFPYYQHSQAAFFLACDGTRPIGRLAVLDNRRHNEYNRTKTAFFYLFECEHNKEAATGLFNHAFDWARSRGLNKIVGPRGFTPMDGLGLLVKGFQHRPAFGLPYNPAYYMHLVESQGFIKEGESVSGYIKTQTEFPPRIHQLAERLAERRGLHILRCRTRSDLRPVVSYLKELYNNSLSGTEGGTPLTDEEVDTMAKQLLWLADPKLVKLVMKGDKAVGFLLAYPDVSAAMQRIRGRLFPFGWLLLWLELRRTDWININGAGLLPEYRGSGGTAILYSEMFKAVSENPRYRHAEVVQIGLENENMQRELENFGIEFYKMHRTYYKEV
jgi:GNAT superfamily N-acetyltransferase